MGIKELEVWVFAKKQTETEARDNARNAALQEEQKRLNRLARVKADVNYLQHSEVYNAFKECAQDLRGYWNDVTLRIVKPKPEYSSRYYSNPRLELTWNYKRNPGISRPRSPLSCDFISVEVDERNPKTHEVVGIKFFQDNLGTYALGVCVPVREVLIKKLVDSIKDPSRRSQEGVEHPSLFKGIAMEFSKAKA
ncbi:MAG: hypothetical protein Q7R31_03930 [Candidatus Levybacteria bacterium]|nr:hypothetical protein [Candidatus Levybacteria bacterium]